MTEEIKIRPPESVHGYTVNQLIKNCPPLDTNSVYANLLQCTHFSSTSAAAFYKGELMGFVSAYQLPEDPKVLFVWQVAVDSRMRGQRLAGRMIENILSRAHLQGITHLHTTITDDNGPSWGLFKSLAKSWEAPLNSQIYFDEKDHFQGHHNSENLVVIGPIKANIKGEK